MFISQSIRYQMMERFILFITLLGEESQSNVVFLYWGIRERPLLEDEFKSYVDKMIRITESGY